MTPHARIRNWCIVECAGPGRPATRHVMGWIVPHGRLGPDDEMLGEPYVGRALASMDIAARVAVNARGKLIELVGDPLPDGDLPLDLRAMQRRAERAWGLLDETIWRRIA